jgi:hypothetical protein
MAGKLAKTAAAKQNIGTQFTNFLHEYQKGEIKIAVGDIYCTSLKIAWRLD